MQKQNVALCMQFMIFFTLLTLLGMMTLFAPAAYELFTIVHENKDRADRTVDTVLRVSEELELVLLDIRSFLEFKLVDALCSSRIIRNTIGTYLCTDPGRSEASSNTSIVPSQEKRATIPTVVGMEMMETLLKTVDDGKYLTKLQELGNTTLGQYPKLLSTVYNTMLLNNEDFALFIEMVGLVCRADETLDLRGLKEAR